MKRNIILFLKHPLISGSALIFAGTFLANIANFFYNVFMGRNLTIADYGTLASLVSIIGLFALAIESFTPTVVHFAASYFAQKEYDMVRGLFIKFTKFTSLLGVVVFSIFFFFSKDISKFFHIQDATLVVLVGCIIMFLIISIVNRALLQAKLAFGFLAAITLLGALLKLIIAAGLVLAGMKVYGAILGFIFSFFIPFFLSFIPLRNIFKGKTNNKTIATSQVISYGAPAALSLVGVTLFISTDVIMVKHFFSPVLAGTYAGLVLVGKVVYFFSSPIGMVMFPLITQKFSKNENYKNIFTLSLLIVFLPSLGFTLLYFLFPEFILGIFFKEKQYLSVAPLLGIAGIFTSLYAILTIVTNFFLSIKKTTVYIPILVGAGVQAIGLWFMHTDFLQVILISITGIAIPLVVFMVYYLRLPAAIKPKVAEIPNVSQIAPKRVRKKRSLSL